MLVMKQVNTSQQWNTILFFYNNLQSLDYFSHLLEILLHNSLILSQVLQMKYYDYFIIGIRLNPIIVVLLWII